MPTLPNTFFSVASPHAGHAVRASSVNDWTMSNWWLAVLAAVLVGGHGSSLGRIGGLAVADGECQCREDGPAQAHAATPSAPAAAAPLRETARVSTPRSAVRKAVIPAAGLGTRFLPATKAQPKEMLPVVDKPAIQYVVEEAVAAGIDDILIITGRSKRSIEDHFDRQFELEYHLDKAGKHDELSEVVDLAELADIHYVRQGEPLGLGHAVSVARSTWATTRSWCCSATSSWPRATRCSPT